MNEKIDWEKHCEGCGECCGPIMFKQKIWEKHKDKAQKLIEVIPFINASVVPLSEDIFCVFLDRRTKRCLIYDERPNVCRLQGTVPRLPCPKLNPELSRLVDKNIDNVLKKLEGDLQC